MNSKTIDRLSDIIISKELIIEEVPLFVHQTNGRFIAGCDIVLTMVYKIFDVGFINMHDFLSRGNFVMISKHIVNKYAINDDVIIDLICESLRFKIKKIIEVKELENGQR